MWARPEQLYDPDDDHDGQLWLAGRGFGKTRSGAEAVHEVAAQPDLCGGRIGIVGRTAGVVRSDMLHGDGGLLTIAKPWFRPKHEPSKQLITWPNGVIAETRSADKLEQIRGPNWGFVWADEIPHWKNPSDAWDMVEFCLRIGSHPRWVGTSTPLPIKLIRGFVADPRVRVVGGSTYDNARNLAPSFFARMKRKYEGTRLGDQELWGRLLEDNPNALFTQDNIAHNRVEVAPDLVRIGVGVDPAVSANPKSNETGIVAGGVDRRGHVYILGDTSGIYTPRAWGLAVARLYDLHEADKAIGEINQGGDLVEANLANVVPHVVFESVRATRGKAIRAEPIGALYEQNRVHHVGDPRRLIELEGQVCAFDPTLPDDQQDTDRLDALVWLITWLVGDLGDARRLRQLSGRRIWEDLRDS